MESLGNLIEQKKRTNQKEDVSAFRQILPQVLATTAKSFLLLSIGMLRAFPAVVVPAVTQPSNNGTTLHLTLRQASWYGGFSYIFYPIGSLISGALLQSLGCKKLMILSNIPVLACWVLSYQASDISDLYFSGALIGFVCGCLGVAPTRYTSETVHPSVRSVLTAYSQLFVSLGFFVVYFLSSLIGWRNVALICGIVPIASTTALLWVPESPMWLMSKNRPEEALQSLQWLRGWTSADSIREEFVKLKIYAEKKATNQRLVGFRQMLKELEEDGEGQSLMVAPRLENNYGDSTVTKENVGNNRYSPIDSKEELDEYLDETSLSEKWHEIARLEMFVPLCKLILLFTASCLCAAAPMQPFMIKNYDELKLPVKGNNFAAILALINFGNGILYMLVVKKFGKKRLFMICSTSCIFCLILLTVFTRPLSPAQGIGPSKDSPSTWVVLALFVINTCSLSLGIWRFPWILLSEILPFKGRGIATGIIMSYYYILIFIGVKLYPILVEVLHLHGTFLFFAIGSIPCVISVYFVVPETEGKFLADIEADISQNIKRKT